MIFIGASGLTLTVLKKSEIIAHRMHRSFTMSRAKRVLQRRALLPHVESSVAYSDRESVLKIGS